MKLQSHSFLQKITPISFGAFILAISLPICALGRGAIFAPALILFGLNLYILHKNKRVSRVSNNKFFICVVACVSG